MVLMSKTLHLQIAFDISLDFLRVSLYSKELVENRPCLFPQKRFPKNFLVVLPKATVELSLASGKTFEMS